MNYYEVQQSLTTVLATKHPWIHFCQLYYVITRIFKEILHHEGHISIGIININAESSTWTLLPSSDELHMLKSD